MKKLIRSKVWGPIIIMLLSTVLPTVFDCFVWLFIRKNFLWGWVLLFLLFGAPIFLSGLFMLLGITKNHEIGAACGFYYGGAVLTALFHGGHPPFMEFLLGFGLSAIIVSLVLSKHRHKDE